MIRIRLAALQPRTGAIVSTAALCSITFLSACGRSSPQPSEPSKNSQPGPAQPGYFVDCTSTSGIDFVHQLADGKMDNIMESDGAGGAIFDYNNDGLPDIYLVNSGPAPILSDAPAGTPRSPNRLYRNCGNGAFEDVSSTAGVEGHGFGTAAAAADYDNDGFTDLLVVNFGSLILYRNQGDGTFKDVTAKAGLLSDQSGISATFVDVDNDGWLDLFVANYLKFDPAIRVPAGTQAPYPPPLAYAFEFNLLFRNLGNGSFEDVSDTSGIRIPNHRAMSAAPVDFDEDGDQDLYVSNDGTPNLLLVNDGQGHFHDEALQRGVGFNQFGEAAGSMGAAIGDCDGNGFPDLFVTRFGNASLYINSQAGLFEDRAQSAGILDTSSRYTGWGGNFLDADNDADLDLLIVNGHAHFLQPMPSLLFLNEGNGRFRAASEPAGAHLAKPLNSRGSMTADFDNDGRVDLLLTTVGGPAVLLMNRIPHSHHWITVQLEGASGNRPGFGALVRVRAGDRVQYAEMRCPTSYVSQSDTRLHFGLGQSERVQMISIRWPGGQSQTFENVAVDQVLTVREPGESRWTKGPRAGK